MFFSSIQYAFGKDKPYRASWRAKFEEAEPLTGAEATARKKGESGVGRHERITKLFVARPSVRVGSQEGSEYRIEEKQNGAVRPPAESYWEGGNERAWEKEFGCMASGGKGKGYGTRKKYLTDRDPGGHEYSVD